MIKILPISGSFIFFIYLFLPWTLSKSTFINLVNGRHYILFTISRNIFHLSTFVMLQLMNTKKKQQRTQLSDLFAVVFEKRIAVRSH